MTVHEGAASLSGEGVLGGILGNANESASRFSQPINRKVASKFALPAGTTIKTIRSYCAATSDDVKAKAVIYADDAGAPAALLATSAEVAGIDTTPGWRAFTFAAPVDLATGDYWLGLIFGDNTLWFYYDDGDANQLAVIADAYADGPSDPFGDPGYASYSLNVYAPLGVPAVVIAASANLSGEGTLTACAVVTRVGATSLSGEGTLTVVGWVVATAVTPVAYATAPSGVPAMAGSVKEVVAATAEAEPTAQAGSAKGQAPKHGFARIPPL